MDKPTVASVLAIGVVAALVYFHPVRVEEPAIIVAAPIVEPEAEPQALPEIAVAPDPIAAPVPLPPVKKHRRHHRKPIFYKAP